jgi:hypothetical protein
VVVEWVSVEVDGFGGDIWWGLLWDLKDGAGYLEVDLTDAVLSSGLILGIEILLRLEIG